MNVELETLEEWIPTESYGYAAFETYKSKMFRLRTGNISVLEFGPYCNGENPIRLKGEVRVDNDQECWDIFLKFRKDQVLTIIQNIFNSCYDNGFSDGQKAFRNELKDLLHIY
jgi:hypothetical protein